MPPDRPVSCRAGMTLIELLIGMAVMSILSGVNAAILSAGLDAWTHAQGRLVLQEVANEMMEVLLEGGPDDDGLRDAIELRDASLQGISIVPLWTEQTTYTDPLKNPERKFFLQKHFKSGAITPIGQIKTRERDEWVNVPLTFTYGGGRDPKRPNDVVKFTDPIPEGAAVRFLYTPDAEIHPETQMRFWWNPDEGQIYRSYAGVTKPIFSRMQGVRVERFAFLYYDNLNRLLPLGQSYSPSELKRITGVKLYLLLQKSLEHQELTSFTNVRNVQTIGATITKGSILPIPWPKEIKAFSVGDFYGLTGEGIVEFVVKTDNQPRWKVRLQFRQAEADRILLVSFTMEAPPGTIRTSSILNQPIAQNEFVNLLGIDRSGLYDYDDDPDLSDAVLITGSNPTVEVTRCDFGVASLFIRP